MHAPLGEAAVQGHLKALALLQAAAAGPQQQLLLLLRVAATGAAALLFNLYNMCVNVKLDTCALHTTTHQKNQ